MPNPPSSVVMGRHLVALALALVVVVAGRWSVEYDCRVSCIIYQYLAASRTQNTLLLCLHALRWCHRVYLFRWLR